MSREYEFIKECGYFFVLTRNGEFPAGRPFGAIMEDDNFLYLATHDGNEVHKQLREDGNIQILAKKEGTREWLRITGKAEECNELSLKEKFMKECPVLIQHYGSADSDRFLTFRVKVLKSEFK